jgi:small nuclear ribonucleoprotein (snRNP)-like protein
VIKLVLPSLTEIIIVIILIIPGFIMSWLFRRITAIGGKSSEFEITVWSLISTLPIYIIFSLITGIQNIETLEENIFSPSYLILLSSLPILLGLSLGLIAKITFRKDFVYGDCWHASLNKIVSRGGYLTVITKDGKEYIGKLHSFGENDTPKELVLRDPEQIIRNKKMKVIIKFKVGKEILFLKNDISRILFFNEINLP